MVDTSSPMKYNIGVMVTRNVIRRQWVKRDRKQRDWAGYV